jgi:hypothetical protein
MARKIEVGADGLVLLETWEAAKNYLTLLSVSNVKSVEIAKLLGWTLPLETWEAATNYLAHLKVPEVELFGTLKCS